MKLGCDVIVAALWFACAFCSSGFAAEENGQIIWQADAKLFVGMWWCAVSFDFLGKFKKQTLLKCGGTYRDCTPPIETAPRLL